jgi:uncharacterized protein (UPF0276 family)
MLDFDTVILENGVEYTEIDKLVYDNVEYVLLSNIKNVKDSCIRKIEIENNEEYLCRLDNSSEYEKILKLFVEKNKALFN